MNLKKQDLKVAAIHGGFTQNKRKRVLEDFQKKRISALICTDVAARGLDIPHVSHVYNYDLPADTKSYIHRIGRTARAGKEGIAINLLSQRDHENFDAILRYERVEVALEETPRFERIKYELDDGRSGGRRQGGRGFDRGGPRRDGPRRDGPRRDGSRRDSSRSDGRGPRRDNRGPRRDDRSSRDSRDSHARGERREGGRSPHNRNNQRSRGNQNRRPQRRNRE